MDLVLLLYFIGGLVGLAAGAEMLVRGASRLAITLGISPVVVGLTVVAFATSAPEFAATLASSLRGEPDIAFGNVVGSNTFNILVVLGASAAIAPLPVHPRLVRIDLPVMIVAALAIPALAFDGVVSRLDGAILFAGIVAYTIALASRRGGGGGGTPDIPPSPAGDRGPRAIVVNVVLVAAGLALLIVGADFLVEGAVGLARAFGVSELVIGLTLVAFGTSLPEVATSIVATVRGQRDIAVGNVVGSCAFNSLGVLGLASLVSPSGVAVSTNALLFDVPVMVAASLACAPAFITGKIVSRAEGFALLASYGAYLAWIVVRTR